MPFPASLSFDVNLNCDSFPCVCYCLSLFSNWFEGISWLPLTYLKGSCSKSPLKCLGSHGHQLIVQRIIFYTAMEFPFHERSLYGSSSVLSSYLKKQHPTKWSFLHSYHLTVHKQSVGREAYSVSSIFGFSFDSWSLTWKTSKDSLKLATFAPCISSFPFSNLFPEPCLSSLLGDVKTLKGS